MILKVLLEHSDEVNFTLGPSGKHGNNQHKFDNKIQRPGLASHLTEGSADWQVHPLEGCFSFIRWDKRWSSIRGFSSHGHMSQSSGAGGYVTRLL